MRPSPSLARWRRSKKETLMWDLIFIALTIVLFATAIWYTRACDKV